MKHVIIFCLTVYLSCSSNAQRIYSGIDAGYSIPVASQNLVANISIGPQQVETSVVKGSLGSGPSLGYIIGYKFSNRLSSEIKINYNRSPEFSGVLLKDNSYQEQVRLYAQFYRLSAYLKSSLTNDVYFKLGPCFRLAGTITTKYFNTDLQTGAITLTEWEFSKGFSVGCSAAAGINRRLNKRIDFLAELAFFAQSWAPTQGKLTRYEINSVDMRERLTTAQTSINFSNSTSVNNKSYSGWNTTQQTKNYFPFSSIAIQMGVNVIIGKLKDNE
jgi:hypothetical protein